MIFARRCYIGDNRYDIYICYNGILIKCYYRPWPLEGYEWIGERFYPYGSNWRILKPPLRESVREIVNHPAGVFARCLASEYHEKV